MTTTHERTCILVLGMHRSGTSALTRTLSLLGAQLPRHIVQPASDNEKGFWEPAKLPQLHDQLLANVGSSWHDCRAIRQSDLPPAQLTEWKQRTRKLLDEEFGDADLFVVKDPRICRFAPLFMETLDEMDVAIRVVIPFRNPLEVADSLARRNDFSQEKSLLLWLRHVLDAEIATRQLPRAFLSY
ncbi:MAG: sulfotransferase family protein, partial [Alphaproteobacteria bacterium]